MSPYERGLVRSPHKTDPILEKALGSRFHDTPEGPEWEPPVCHLGDFFPITSRRKTILSFFDALPSRKSPSTAEDPKADLQCLQEDHVMQHEEEKKCDQSSRNFQPSWKKTYPSRRFIERQMYCATWMDSNKSAERLGNPNLTFVTGTDNFRLDSIRSHGSSVTHVQVTKAFMFRCNPEEAPLHRALAAVSEEVQLKTKILFRC